MSITSASALVSGFNSFWFFAGVESDVMLNGSFDIGLSVFVFYKSRRKEKEAQIFISEILEKPQSFNFYI
jgi:hypothetical protein